MEVFQQHRARRDLAALEAPRPPLRRQRRLRLHRREQHDIVVDFDLDFAAAQAEPADGLQLLDMMAASVEPDFAAIVERSLHRDGQHGAAAVGVADLGVRELDKVSDLEHPVERLQEIGVGALGLGLIPDGVR